MNELATIILAAGKGTRMNSKLHKVLHPIAGRPMIRHLMASAARLGSTRTVVVIGEWREQVREVVGDEVHYAVQDDQLGTGHAVAQAKEALADHEGDVLVLYGDVPFVRTETMEAMCARLHGDDRPAVVVLGFRPADTRAYGRIIAAEDGRIDRMVEHGDATEEERACRLCNSGVMAVKSSELFDLLDRVGNDNAKGEYYLTDIVNLANEDGRTCAVVETADEDEVTGINSRLELAEAEQQWQDFRREEAMEDGVTLREPESVYFSWDTKLGREVVVEPNVVFGPGVVVEDEAHIRAFSHLEGAQVGEGCVVGPFARLRPGTVLKSGVKVGNFVEIKNAVLGEGAKASHLSYIGDATVGAQANIGAGTITCNYDGYFKHHTEIGDRAFIGSNSSLIAPVKIGRDAIVGAGSAVSRDVGDGDMRMVRGEQLVKPGWADRFHDRMTKKKKKARDDKA